MKYKTPREEQELEQAPLSLQLVANFFEHICSSLWNIEPVVTRVLDPVAGESGVHQDYRAIDFRDELGVGGPHMFTDNQVDTLVSEMNKKFPRADHKLVCIHHAFVNHKDPYSTRAPYHFHVQIPWEAKKEIPEEWKDNA